ncbi:TraR/DksA C4-type zinc finger protein [Ralstonia pseudosolanacearum]|uniref:TraR/DksA C4-type zinc finger protein n=1 Tax=Ralstonia pseudosolanacearum TaxID=1310165 RepID=UPI0008D98FC0|nr:TraR/DksA C4-type zinc finger protein [Ralstonia pseudosolanacearum]MCL1618350.1 TraR/DksA C4-type zinc finger protein [Ralstonia pseudosolanacearum CaRs-Mep]
MTADIFDRASELEERQREEAIARVRAVCHSGKPSRKACLDCDAPIPEARRQAVPGCTLCIDCASQREKRQHGTR